MESVAIGDIYAVMGVVLSGVKSRKALSLSTEEIMHMYVGKSNGVNKRDKERA
jgi:hypothetical protein